MPKWAWAVLIVLGAGLVVERGVHYRNLQNDLRSALLRVDSLQAVNDTTRLLELERWSDSVRVYQRRIVQLNLEADSLDRLLGLEKALQASLSVRIDSLRAEASSSVTESSDTLRMHFEMDSVPVRVQTAVTVFPEAEGVREAEAEFAVSLYPLTLDARIGCSGEEVSRGELTLVAPSWAEVSIDSVVQDPRVCNPEWERPVPFYQQTRYQLYALVVLGMILFR